MKNFSTHFLVGTSQQHQAILTQMGLENFCVEPYFSNLRHNMRELLELLAAVAAGVPQQHYGFHRSELNDLKTPLKHLEIVFDPVMSVTQGAASDLTASAS